MNGSENLERGATRPVCRGCQTLLQEAFDMTDLQILLYVIGGLLTVALVWSAFDVRKRKAKRRVGHE